MCSIHRLVAEGSIVGSFQNPNHPRGEYYQRIKRLPELIGNQFRDSNPPVSTGHPVSAIPS
jgi:hypothetical protein